MAEHEEREARRRLAVLGVLDLPVGAVDADPEHLHPDPASAGDVGDVSTGKLGQVGAARLAREHRDGFHDALLFGSAGVSSTGISWLCCSSLATSAGPARLVAGADAGAVVAVEVLVEQDQSLPVRIAAGASDARRTPGAGRSRPRRKMRDSRREMSAATSPSVSMLPRPRRALHLEVVAE